MVVKLLMLKYNNIFQKMELFIKLQVLMAHNKMVQQNGSIYTY